MASPAEQHAYAHMQARLIALLLRHDVGGFRRFIDARSDNAEDNDNPLGHYRDLAVLFFLRDELFEHILPRIIRRLSFESPRTLQYEEPPARGRVDWGRTLDATWDERPGEVPLVVATRQRRRDFATPENLLTVATLLEYRSEVQRLLWDEQLAIGADALRHPLNEIVERCERELAFPQFAGLRAKAQRALDEFAGGTETLEQQVSERLLPGGNSAYEELLQWRRRLRELRLLRRDMVPTANDVLGADPSRDNYLYQLWIFYELADMLQTSGCLEQLDAQRGAMRLRFRWSDEERACTYELRHDQQVSSYLPPVARWAGHPNPKNIPGVRPDFYLYRVDPPLEQVPPKSHPLPSGDVYWREPGVVWDAKYYRERESERTPSSPVKRMLADLTLLGESVGVLLFAFLQQPSVAAPMDAVAQEQPEQETATGVRFAPVVHQEQTIIPDLHIQARQLRPAVVGDAVPVHKLLAALLDDAHGRMAQPRIVRCHGVFLDTLSADAHGALASVAGLRWRNGSVLDAPLDDLLLCPKPHVGPWRVDIVSHSRDCCQNAPLCHIKHQPGARKPQRLTALEDIAQAIRVSDGGEGDDETVAAVATQQVLAITKRYAQLLQPDISHYKQWVNDELEVGDLWTQTALLTDGQRETMALARFLWEQIEHIRASNFAGPTLLFTGVLEELTRVTIYRQSGKLYGANGQPLHDTLGTLGNCKQYGGTNWSILERVIVQGGFWQEQVAEQQALAFSTWIDMVKSIAYIRNDAAHKANVDRKAFQRLIQLYFGGSLSGIGVFNGLLLAWRAAQV